MFDVSGDIWLLSNDLAMISVILPTIWAGMGPGSIIYLAALHGVPDDLYEAAELDGASIFNKIRHVSIPYIRPLIFINFLGAPRAGAHPPLSETATVGDADHAKGWPSSTHDHSGANSSG